MRQQKKTPLFENIDISKPLPIYEMQSNIKEDDCFGKEWMPDDKMCSICSEQLVCGTLFKYQQTKLVKSREQAKGGYLDSSLFDDLHYEDVIAMLSKKPMTPKELVDKVQKFTNCPDRDTCKHWVLSFIKENETKLTIIDKKLTTII